MKGGWRWNVLVVCQAGPHGVACLARPSLGAALGLATLTTIGCGGEGAGKVVTRTIAVERYGGEPQKRSWSDSRGDVRVIAEDERPPSREPLDLTGVTLRRIEDRLEVTFQTAAPPREPMTQNLYVLDSRSARKAATVVRHVDGRKAEAVSRSAEGSFEPVPIKSRGAKVVVQAPLSELTRRGRFRWRVWLETKGEIVDRIPSRAGDYNFFPHGR